MINTRLSRLATGEASRDEADQDKPPVPLSDHERTPAVSLAGVLAPVPVAGAHHLRVELDGDAGPLVPHLALPVLYQRDVHHLQHLRPLLLLGDEEGEGPQLVVRDDGPPPGGVCDGAGLNDVEYSLQLTVIAS